MLKKYIFVALFAVLGFATAGMVTAASINLSWTAPTTRVSGTPLAASELAGYEITLNGVTIASPPATVTSYTYTIAEGACIKTTDVFAERAKDTNGIWSAYSTSAYVGADVCTPKSAPVAPTLKISVAP